MHVPTIRILLVVLCLLEATPASSYAQTFGKAQLLPNGDRGAVREEFSKMASDGNGNWVAIWGSNNEGLRFDCQNIVARSTDNGKSWTLTATLGTLGQCGGEAGLATDKAGNWIAVWNEASGLYVSRSTDVGATWTTPTLLDANPLFTNGSDPNVVTDEKGTWILLWATTTGLVTARSVDNGISWSRAVILEPTTDDSGPFTGNSQIATDRNGTWLAVWNTNYQFLGMRYSRSLNDGRSWSTPQSFSDEDIPGPLTSNGPSIATDENGNWIIAVADRDGAPTYPVILRSSNNGASWGSYEYLSLIKSVGSPAVATDGKGSWIAAWTNYVAPREVWIARSSDLGRTWTSPVAVKNPDGYLSVGGDPRLVYDRTDTWMLSWSASRGAPFFDTRLVASRSTPVLELTLVDPNSPILDSYLQLRGLAPTTKTKDALLRDVAFGEATRITGLAADGVTPVLVRVELPQDTTATEISIELADENGVVSADNGTLQNVDGTVSSSIAPITVPVQVLEDGNGRSAFAFAIVKAPLDFVRAASETDRKLADRPLRVRAVAQGLGEKTEALSLYRPPVTLVHGLWSDDKTYTWDWMGVDPRFVESRYSYADSHADHFACNISAAVSAVRDALKEFRSQKNAAVTQADYVGHSMGGLLARLHIADFPIPRGLCDLQQRLAYKRTENFFAGDIHKLITIATPHRGSPWANFLIDADGKLTGLGEAVEPHVGCRQAAVNPKGCITGGAVGDLRMGSQIFQNLPQAVVPVHAIVAVGGSDLLNLIGAGTYTVSQVLAGAPHPATRAIVWTSRAIAWSTEVFNAVFGLQHDMVVPFLSQKASLAAKQSSNTSLGNELPTELAIHTTVTGDPRVGDKVLELLDARTKSRVFADKLPAYSSSSEPPLPDPSSVQVPIKLRISKPKAGDVVEAGATVKVRMKTNVKDIQKVLVLGPGMAIEKTEPPFSVDLPVDESALGEAPVTLVAIDQGGNIFRSRSTYISVRTSAGLVALKAEPSPISIGSLRPRVQVYVEGIFSDGVRRNVTARELGTRYKVADQAIAEVSPSGFVFAKKNGSTMLKIRNGAVATNVPIEIRECGSVDTDNDNVMDACDNCVLVANAKQRDQNSNGIGNACETLSAVKEGL